MANQYVYVPITVKGLIIGQPPENKGNDILNVNKKRFADISDDYSRIVYSKLGEYIPSQFQVQNDLPRGIHLHWSLPDALTNGTVDHNTGEINLRAVPDVWIVTRMWADKDKPDSTIKLKSWRIESSAISEKRSSQIGNLESWAIPDTGGSFYYLGRSMEFGRESQYEKVKYLRRLTAIEADNPVYSAYYHTCRNVFGFYDDMTAEKQALCNVRVTYCVAGCYANPDNEVLKQINGNAELVNELNWKIADAAGLEKGAKTVCHGMLCNINWEASSTDYGSGIPEQTPYAAIGNNSYEALAALVSSMCRDENVKAPTERMINHMLAGFPHEIMAKDGIANSEIAIHESRFTPYSAYSQYYLKALESEYKTEIKEPSSLLEQALKKFNEDLDTYHMLAFQIEYGQTQIFELWYRFEKLRQLDKTDSRLLTELQNKVKAVEALKQEQQQLKINTKEKQLRQECANEQFEAAVSTEQRFWEPNNPTILLAGLPRNFMHGEDGRFSQDGSLIVRTQTISTMKYEPKLDLMPALKQNTLTAFELMEPSHVNRGYEDFYLKLLYECALLSPSFSDQIAFRLCRKNNFLDDSLNRDLSNIISIIQRYSMLLHELTVSDDIAEVCKNIGFDQRVPEKSAVAYWEQPWYPLYMDWVVDFYPDERVVREAPDIKSWNSGRGEGKAFSYDFMNQTCQLRNDNALTLSGRIFITPYLSHILKEKLPELNVDIRNIDVLNILSQSMNGFHEQLTMNNLVPMPIDYKYVDSKTDIVDEMGKVRKLYMVMQEILDKFTPQSPLFDVPFLPVRAGFLEIREIRIIDSFGQFQQLGQFNCAVAESLRPPESLAQEGLITLPPRVLEPLKINFKWAEDNCICGYIVPDFDDYCIVVFSASGEQIGSVQYVEKRNGTAVVWKTSITKGGGSNEPLNDIENEFLLDFVQKLIANVQKKKEFLGFLDAMNHAMWQMNPSVSKAAMYEHYLFGKPIAVVRARIGMETLFPRKKYKSFQIFVGQTRYPDVDIEKLRIKVQIGLSQKHRDGVFGFFKDDDYTSLYWNFDDKVIKNCPYFQLEPTMYVCPNAAEQKITLLMDIFEEVNIFCGLLPVKTIRFDTALAEKSLKQVYNYMFVAPTLQFGDELKFTLTNIEGKCWKWSQMKNEHCEIRDANNDSLSFAARFEAAAVCAKEGWLYLQSNEFDRQGSE